MPQTKASFLKGRSTGYLLSVWRHPEHFLRQWRNRYEDHYEDVYPVVLHDKGQKPWLEFEFTREEIKAELDRRPHLPRKPERTALIKTRKALKSS